MSSVIFKISCNSCEFSNQYLWDYKFEFIDGDSKRKPKIEIGWCEDCQALCPVIKNGHISKDDYDYSLIVRGIELASRKTMLENLFPNKKKAATLARLKSQFEVIMECDRSYKERPIDEICIKCKSPNIKSVNFPKSANESSRCNFSHSNCGGELSIITNGRISRTGDGQILVRYTGDGLL